MTGLTAWTNRPGNNYRKDRFTSYFVGKLVCGAYKERYYDDLFDVEYATKYVPTPGYAGCTDWARKVQKFTINEPAKLRRLVYQHGICDNTDVITDFVGDDHLLRRFHLGDINPSDVRGNWENASNESITKALNNLTEHYAGIGNDLAEARKTCDMFAGAALRAGGFLKAFRDKNWQYFSHLGGSDIKSAQKTLANLWLEYVYGWKPLASDLYEAQILAHEALLKPVPIMARASGKGTRSQSLVVNGADVNIEYKVDARTYLEANVTNSYLHSLSSAGLINPLSIAWEVVPFSFVVDWFIPIGASLQAITAGVGLSLNKGYTSSHEFWQVDYRMRVNSHPPGESFYDFVSAGHLQETGYQFRRQCHASFPNPRLYADVTPYSTPRALNALALVRQLL